ncbi:MAG: hypothetical protein JSU96_07345 [Acidobacteriota bacterium]|nr:MAG: hypothetical protein JSU96_07345 [Acidobacteriota bacterium]
MSQIFEFTPEQVYPSREAVFQHQGVPPGARISEQSRSLLERSFELFEELAAPIGMLAPISPSDFSEVLTGEGENEEHHPVLQIFPKGDSLALFAATLGPEISDRVQQYFQDKDVAMGYTLDSVASIAADIVADLVQARFDGDLKDASPDTGVLRYSPGYCGWHVSGQKKLFRYLNPSQIGISLNESCLMSPIKSVSGVLIAGPKQIHIFPNSYSFCALCPTQSCRSRIRDLLSSERWAAG